MVAHSPKRDVIVTGKLKRPWNWCWLNSGPTRIELSLGLHGGLGLALFLHEDPIVEAQLALGHARQERLHHDLAGHVSLEHLACDTTV